MKVSEPKISILIRSYNEAKWIRICIQNLLTQTIRPFEILLIDNNSNDGTIEIAKKNFSKIKIYKFNKKYTPGGMLNFGMKKTKGNLVLILSAHCIPCDSNLIKNLIKPFKSNKEICGTYARQVSLNFSDDLTIRDLMLTYGTESKLQKNDPQFNNACSLIKKTEWINNKFDKSLSNLEDRYWAAQKLKNKKLIYYCAEAKVFHYHGSHHNNNENRLKQTKKTILFNKKSFGISSDTLKIKEADIFPVYIHNKAPKVKLLKNIGLINKKFKQKFLIFINGNIGSNFKKKYFTHKRKKEETQNQNYYLSDVLNFYKKIILKHSKDKEYLLICSDDFSGISSSFLKKSVKLINDYFPDTIFAAKKTIDPIFMNNNGETIRLNKLNKSRKENKPLLIGKRNHGILIHTSNLFKVDKFSGIIKLIS